MKLETYAKIGIISGISVAVLVGIDLTLMVLNHEFGYDFRNIEHALSEEKQQEIVDSFYVVPEYVAFKERFPDSRSQIQADEDMVKLILTQYEPSTQNRLELEIIQFGSDDFVHTEAKCDLTDRSSKFREYANGGITLDFIKTTPCVDPSQ